MTLSAPRLVLDVETASQEDLPRAGAARYARDPSTRVTVACWKIRVPGSPHVVRGTWVPTRGDAGTCPVEVAAHVQAGHPVVAHNYLFEANIWDAILGPLHGWPAVDPAQWSCTMARALYHGLPAALAHLGPALKLSIQKDPQARGLMLRFARPRSLRPDGTPVWWHETEPARFDELIAYCANDVDTEDVLDCRVPELPDQEREIWLLDGVINQRGLPIDLTGVGAMRAFAVREQARLNQRIVALTAGAASSANAVVALLAWINPRLIQAGLAPLANLTKATVSQALEDPGLAAQAPLVREVVQLRQAASRSSVAKLDAMRAAIDPDGWARGLFAFYGAGRTGRWAGRRVQPQNFVRGYAHPEWAIDAVTRDPDPTALSDLWGEDALSIVANSMRGHICAKPGYGLVVADLAQIEARMIAWLSGQRDVLDVFRRGEDVYVYAAKQQGSSNRQFGKVIVLACGFGMGWERFQATARLYGIDLSDLEAMDAVAGFRGTSQDIVNTWYEMDRAVIAITGAPVGTRLRVGSHLVLWRTKGSVRLILPSGRPLVYYDPQIQIDPDPRFNRPQFTYMGVNSYTKLWTRLRSYGGKVMENATQGAARDVMAEGMRTMGRLGHRLIGTVHDETLTHEPVSRVDYVLSDQLTILRTPPLWAPGLPVDAAGYIAQRYRK